MAITVTDNEGAKRRAQAQKHEAILVVGMVGVVDEQGMIVKEDRLSFLERNAMLALIEATLSGVPVESKATHETTV